ncbi:FAD/NAD(P)-binding domain-containing protein [Imleria badia]|nr:FAD/NAD(P)-binding domain-containing protein [Imleria badia]
MFEFTSHPTYERAELQIDFLVVGGGLAGLSCALALRRVGHRVVVLEQFTDSETSKMSHGGIRLPPNVVKILYKWGLKDALKAISVECRSFEMAKYETGEVLGMHVWDEDIFTETGGAFLLCHHADLRRLLFDAAVEAGAQVHSGVKGVSVDCDACQVTLSTGVKLQADVIVGADGYSSLIQQAITGKNAFRAEPSHCLFYNTTIPVELMQQDPALADFCNSKHKLFVWLGHNTAVSGFHLGGKAEYALHLWVQPARHKYRDDEFWAAEVTLKELRQQLGLCEPRLLKLAALAKSPARVQVKITRPLENWVHHSGRVLVIGEAAHPLPAGSIQGGALAVEDSAVLAKLFSHLRSEDQIPTFLYALQELREGRCASVVKCEQGNLLFQMMPHGPQQEQRDNMLRKQVAEGRPMLSNSKPLDQWEQVKELFGYDPEDQADDWWIKWGILRERAKDRTRCTSHGLSA